MNSIKLNDIPGNLVILVQIKQMCECEGVWPKYVARRSVLLQLLWLEILDILWKCVCAWLCIYILQEPMVWPTHETSCVRWLGTRIAKCPRATLLSTSTKESSSPANRWWLFFLVFNRIWLCVPAHWHVHAWHGPTRASCLPYYPV